MKDEAFVAALLFVAGKMTGSELVSHALSSVTETEVAKMELYRLARALVRLARDDQVTVKDERGERVWKLSPDAERNWSNEVLGADESGVH